MLEEFVCDFMEEDNSGIIEVRNPEFSSGSRSSDPFSRRHGGEDEGDTDSEDEGGGGERRQKTKADAGKPVWQKNRWVLCGDYILEECSHRGGGV